MHARPLSRLIGTCAVLVTTAGVGPAFAQPIASTSIYEFPAHIILPQRRVIEILPRPRPIAERVRVTQVMADVLIRDGIATTALTIHLENPGRVPAEAVVLLPVPDQSVIRAFSFDALGTEAEAKLLPREEARRIYDAIVARSLDPALLEFVGLNVVRSSAFPIAPRATQAVTLTYEQVLPADGDRRDYILPRSAALDCEVPWNIRVRVRDQLPIASIYSPSHEIEERKAANWSPETTISLARGSERTAGSFVLSYVVARGNKLTATAYLHPAAHGAGGHFLLLIGAPAQPEHAPQRLRREVTLVLDRSGSMRGEKLEQAKEAARQLVAGLEQGERFHLITYNEAIETCSDAPEIVTAESRRRALAFIDEITARGGTNISDALIEALRPAPAKGFVPVVLFLTDGLPTVGTTSEKAIREIATTRNPHQCRIFTFGVGTEVNTPLLQSLALASRGVPTFVLPGEDIEVKMSAVFRRLAGPIISRPQLATDDSAAFLRGRLRDVLPQPLPDIFAGDETLIFGRYTDNRPIDFTISGAGENAASIRVTLDPASASLRHSFVPRLWASRQIGVLVAALRDLGADTRDPHLAARDPAARELIDEIVQLSTEFGILTEFTAFLAEEGTPLPAPVLARERAQRNAISSASARSGELAMSMESNNTYKLQQRALNPGNRVYDEKLVVREVRSIQQVATVAFYQRGTRWIDSRLALKGETEPTPARVIELGTAAHRALIDRLVRENRQVAATLSGDVYLELDGETVLLRNG